MTEKKENKYVCICGKHFTNSQSFNAHKSKCKIHQINKYGTLENYNKHIEDISKKSSETLKKRYKQKQKDFLDKWISEQHKCEKCGNIMTSYYGSGRFCSRSCANSRVYLDESKKSISIKLIKNKNPNLTEQECLNKYNINRNLKSKVITKTVYKLPNIDLDNNLKQGYFSRTRIPYSERFWKQVLDNNKISYKSNVNIWKPGPNNYFLDFLIDEKIDLEIDGKFHEQKDVYEKDLKRDAWLKSLGYDVYRIKWVNPTSNKNKTLVNKQIDDLFRYLNKSRIC